MSMAVIISILAVIILVFVFRKQIIVAITGSIALVVCIFCVYFILDNGGIGNWHIRDNTSLKQYDEAKENPKGTIEYLKDKITGNETENPAKNRSDEEYGKSESQKENDSTSIDEDKTDDNKIWSEHSKPVSENEGAKAESKDNSKQKYTQTSKNMTMGQKEIIINFNQVSNFIDKNDDLLTDKDRNILKGITPLTSQKFKGDNIEILTKKSKVIITPIK